MPEGSVLTKRFLRDYPNWFLVVKACAVEAERSRGEFAGAWVMQEAQKMGLPWFPNLRPLVSYGILRRTGVARGGRRAYYVMVDVEGVKAALKDRELELNEAATEALGSAMYRFTFGIIGDAKGSVEGRGLGTGIGLRWNETYLILTAAHTVQETPYERLYFLLPDDTVQFFGSKIPAQPTPVQLRHRFQLDDPKALLADDEDDLAALILPEQPDETKRHFYELDEARVTPTSAKQVGFLGYTKATALSVGDNFVATLYLSFGEKSDVPSTYDPKSRMSVSYPLAESVDPHGLSGSGLWVSPNPGIIWSPNISLVGLITDHDSKLHVLIGYRVERLIEFLKSKNEWMRHKST